MQMQLDRVYEPLTVAQMANGGRRRHLLEGNGWLAEVAAILCVVVPARCSSQRRASAGRRALRCAWLKESVKTKRPDIMRPQISAWEHRNTKDSSVQEPPLCTYMVKCVPNSFFEYLPLIFSHFKSVIDFLKSDAFKTLISTQLNFDL